MRTLSRFLDQQPFSPYEFGAIGDGVADDLIPLRNAAAAAAAANGILLIPKGVFGISQYVQVPNGVKAVLGSGGTIKGLAASAFELGLSLPGKNSGQSSNVNGCHIEGLVIDMNGRVGVGIGAETAPTVSLPATASSTVRRLHTAS